MGAGSKKKKTSFWFFSCILEFLTYLIPIFISRENRYAVFRMNVNKTLTANHLRLYESLLCYFLKENPFVKFTLKTLLD